jgi:arylsulfatase A-like enzyme
LTQLIRPAAMAFLLLCCASPALAQARKPDIVVILADDLGYGDTGAYGSRVIHTPNIDALAASGVRFTAGYVTNPVCAPSRAGLLTGRYQQRFGYEFNPRGRDRTGGMSLEEITLAQVMKSAGYVTGAIGKWHLGRPGAYYPTRRGFDEFFGMAGGGSTYLIDPRPGDEIIVPRRRSPDATLADIVIGEDGSVQGAALTSSRLKSLLGRMRARQPISREGKIVTVDGYLPEAFTRAAVDFIDRNRTRPFFLYMAYHLPHVPFMATRKYLDRYRNIRSPADRVYAAMVSALDDGVGAVEAELRATGLDGNTLVFFLSDNGCPDYDRDACSNSPLSGFKGWPLEGGVRVPFIVSWPGHLPAGRVDARQISSLDIVPTAAAAAHATLPPHRSYDGVDLMPYLTGRDLRVPNPVLYWRDGPTWAVRDGAMKLIVADSAPPVAGPGRVPRRGFGDRTPASPDVRHVMLYDLDTDLAERQNLATMDPGAIERLHGLLESWNRTLCTPQWPSERQRYVEYDGALLHLYD